MFPPLRCELTSRRFNQKKNNALFYKLRRLPSTILQQPAAAVLPLLIYSCMLVSCLQPNFPYRCMSVSSIFTAIFPIWLHAGQLYTATLTIQLHSSQLYPATLPIQLSACRADEYILLGSGQTNMETWNGTGMLQRGIWNQPDRNYN